MKPKTISQEQETHINEALATLKRLEAVQDILPSATYRAAQRDALRRLVIKTFHHVEVHHNSVVKWNPLLSPELETRLENQRLEEVRRANE